ncbi:hypothetical protein [Halalkalicoccus salilacus]|uniref:hypothetical protein n=1 Tax=Halalkalicoccus TaxID=332246 RepID=UPI002F969D0E
MEDRPPVARRTPPERTRDAPLGRPRVPREIDDDRVVGLIDAEGEPIENARPVLWEVRTY